ncbi:MAG TPA: zinc ribbon domain-containing protein [Candidatus Nitrosotalea sp.]|nr:zinc ribbon domain-containing protein [Nitrososphaerota archaeon]HKU32287.1 zinc ribbon domain-containing protein [Candidatus Nitrosotalea sp.]
MYCIKCGSQLPDDAAFCVKCGAKQQTTPAQQEQPVEKVSSQSSGVTEIKCPSCGAPISPKFGEMVITCEYCGSSITLENKGWKNIEKHTMLPISLIDKDDVTLKLKKMMDKGLFHRHLQETSTLEEINLSMIPYWIIPVAARTNLVATDIAAEVGNIATTAALFGVMGGAMGGGFGGGQRSGGMGVGMMDGMLMGSMLGGGGMMGSSNTKKAYTIDENYNCPVIALKALTMYQPHDYEFALDGRVDFDPKKIPKSIKILNGDINEDLAKNQAKTIADRLQTESAHSKYHMIQQMQTQLDVSSGELLHVPIWFAKYDHKGKKIILVIDANSGAAINSIGL